MPLVCWQTTHQRPTIFSRCASEAAIGRAGRRGRRIGSTRPGRSGVVRASGVRRCGRGASAKRRRAPQRARFMPRVVLARWLGAISR